MEVKSFWNGKRVLVTGHTGFKGAWLTLWLQKRGAEVFGFALKPPTQPNLFDDLKLAREITSVTGDVRNERQLTQCVQSARPDVVFHLAAQSLVRRSYLDPAGTYSTNVMGTVNLLNALKKTQSVRSVVIVTSDKCYENTGKKKGYTENDPMGGYDPYSNSKGCQELVVSSYRRSYFSAGHAGLASARAGNVIGGGDWAKDRLIPDLVRALRKGARVQIRNPKATRPWQFVLEPLSGYLTLAEKLWSAPSDYAEGWNFGPSPKDTRPVEWIVRQVADHFRGDLKVDIRPDKKLHEAQVLSLDASKAIRELGWEPRLSAEKALEWTVAWYDGFLKGRPPRPLMERQISTYERIVNS